MNNEVDITPLVDTGYVQEVIQEGRNAVFQNGRLAYIILDIDKPSKTFFDLRSVFNASTGEGGKDLKIMFMNSVVPWQLNGKRVGIVGEYPSGEPFTVTGATNQASSSLIDFIFPQGLFQEAGIYKFQFVISDDGGNIATSHYCFFQVTQSAMSMALDWNNGVNPYDNDYLEWKKKVENEVTNLSSTIGTLQSTVDTFTSNVNTVTDNAWNKKLGQENTWTAKQHFDGGLTANDLGANSADIMNLTVEDWFDAKKDLTVEQALHVKGSVDLPSNVTFANPILQYESNSLAAGLFPCEGYWYADIAGGGKNNVACWGVNGVSGKYFSFRKFRYTARDGDTNSALMEIHADASIPTSAFGKPIIQFNNANLEGVDGTHFMFGGHELSFKASENALYCWGYAPGNSNNNECNDSTMV